MARETKVGLLTGLAFIICFAVILANRGGHGPSTSHTPFLPDGTGVAVDQGQRSASRTPAHHPSLSGREVGANDRNLSRPPIPQRIDRTQPARTPQSGAEFVFSNSEPSTPDARPRHPRASSPADRRTEAPPAQTQVEQSRYRNHQPTRQSQTRPGNPTLNDVADSLPPPTGPTPGAAARQRELEQRLAAASGSGPSHASPVGSEANLAGHPSTRPTPPVRTDRTTTEQRRSDIGTGNGTPYTVVAGDTLSKIADAHYGSKSRRFVGAIFDANRTILASPDKIRVGMVLTIPVSEDTGARSHAGGNPATRSAVRRTSPPPVQQVSSPRSFRWYQIKKTDRYVSIAREELGDETRWHELYELNKDKFPDADKIREGVRIKLPLRRTATP